MHEEMKELNTEEMEQVIGGSAAKIEGGKKITCSCGAVIELTIPQILSHKSVRCPVCSRMVDQESDGANRPLKSEEDRKLLKV